MKQTLMTIDTTQNEVSATTTETGPALSSTFFSCAKTSLRLAGAALLALLSAAHTTVSAADRYVATERFTEYATVIDVQPIYQEVRLREPRQECTTVQEEYIVGYEQSQRYERYQSHGNYRRNNTSNAVVGGLIGGVIGNQLGRGHSRESRAGATVAGVIIGGALGNETASRSTRHRRDAPRHHTSPRPIYGTRPVERCTRVSESRIEQRLKHYNVTYRYKGRQFVTQMPRDPGNRIELQVSVAPARR